MNANIGTHAATCDRVVQFFCTVMDLIIIIVGVPYPGLVRDQTFSDFRNKVV